MLYIIYIRILDEQLSSMMQDAEVKKSLVLMRPTKSYVIDVLRIVLKICVTCTCIKIVNTKNQKMKLFQNNTFNLKTETTVTTQ